VHRGSGAVEYLVRWAGFDADESTWEPENVLLAHSREQVEHYYRCEAEADAAAAQKKRKKPPSSRPKPTPAPRPAPPRAVAPAATPAAAPAAVPRAPVHAPPSTTPCPKCFEGSGKMLGHRGAHCQTRPQPKLAGTRRPCPHCVAGSGKFEGHLGRHLSITAEQRAEERRRLEAERSDIPCPHCRDGSGKMVRRLPPSLARSLPCPLSCALCSILVWTSLKRRHMLNAIYWRLRYATTMQIGHKGRHLG